MTKLQAVATTPTDIKSQLDNAWSKVEAAMHQEAEGCDLWIAGSLELINILANARKCHASDQAFGAWLTENGYGEDRLTRHNRQALSNMGHIYREEAA